MKQPLALRLMALLPFRVVADLPVHCLRHQIVGDWEFSLSPAKTERPSCGHQRPDSQDKQPPVSLLASLGPTTALKLSVQDPDSVSTSKGDVGTWTMIYDEGWEVAVGGKVFFAFSMFEMVPDGHGGQTNVSRCDETLVGWYRDSTRTRWGCYHGRKAGHRAAARSQQAAAPEGQDAAARGTAAVTRGAAAGRSSSLVSKASIFDYSSLAAEDASDGAEGRAGQDDESDAGASADDQEAPEPSSGSKLSAPAADGAADAAPAAAEAPAAPAQAEAEQAALAALVQSGEEEEQDEEDEGAEDSADGAAQPAPAAAQPAPAGGGQSFLADVYNMPSSYTPWVPKSAGYDKPMQHRWQQAVAEALNFMQLGWTATAHSIFTGKTPRELNRFAGTRRVRIPPQHKSPGPAPAPAWSAGGAGLEALSFMALRSKRKRERSKERVDWRAVNGKNWLEPVISQGDCGSCYAISTVHMLTSRNRIKRGDPSEPAFSVTFPLQCSEYNQGCNGGYGFLESKWAEDVGLVPEHCAPFTDEPGACQALEDCDLGDRRYRAVNHRYVGGFYGGSDHEQIKQELVTNGPLVLSFEPKEDFMYYKSGLYRSGLNKIHQEWEQVDHAVLLIGLGSDGGQPYWVMQNSWGTQWGEDGFFRMARGIDESGCESIAVAADVVQDSGNDVLDNFLASL